MSFKVGVTKRITDGVCTYYFHFPIPEINYWWIRRKLWQKLNLADRFYLVALSLNSSFSWFSHSSATFFFVTLALDVSNFAICGPCLQKSLCSSIWPSQTRDYSQFDECPYELCTKSVIKGWLFLKSILHILVPRTHVFIIRPNRGIFRRNIWLCNLHRSCRNTKT